MTLGFTAGLLGCASLGRKMSCEIGGTGGAGGPPGRGGAAGILSSGAAAVGMSKIKLYGKYYDVNNVLFIYYYIYMQTMVKR